MSPSINPRFQKYKFRLYILPLVLLIALTGGCSGQSAGAGNKGNEHPSAAATGATGNSGTAQAEPAAAVPEETVDLSGVTLRVGQTGWGNYEAGLKAAGLLDTSYKVKFSVFQGGNLQLEAMAADQLDLGLTSEIPPIFASQAVGGGNFKVVAVMEANTLLQELVVPGGSPISSVAELKGKKVGYVSSTTAEYFLVEILKEAGLAWSDIEPVQLSTADGLTALIGGNIDALASYGNAIITAHQKGATTLASARDILSGNFLVCASLGAITDPGQHAAIADFLGRLNQFYDWSRDHQEQWAQITADNTHQPLEQALSTFKDGEQQKQTRIIPTTPEGIQSEQKVADALLLVGSLKGKIDVGVYWSTDFNSEIR